MTRTTHTTAPGQPTLDDLMVRFLSSRGSAPTELFESEVEPYEVAAGFRVDPRTAWTDATAAVHGAGPTAVPAEWATLIGLPAAAFAVPCAAGSFPQRVKDLQPLLTEFDPADLRPTGSQLPVPGLSGLRTWIIKQLKTNQPAAVILAAGVARAIGELDWADELLRAVEGSATGALRAVWENERAALLWDRGRGAEALAAWEAMTPTPTVRFNRGMARLFLGRPAEARADLTAAADALPETNGWNALARLYLTLAEIHG